MQDVSTLIARLASHRPQPPSEARSIFSALGLQDNEEPYSDFLAWLLAPRGPLTDGWLLDAVLTKFTALEHLAGETPDKVVREHSTEHGRPDIVIQWPSAKLVIENKVHSSEGKGQCARYLRTLGDEGELIYLTRRGTSPSSIRRSEERLTCVGYHELAETIVRELGEAVEPEPRASMLATELARTMSDISGRSLMMDELDKPQPTDATLDYLANADKLIKIENQAKRESEEIIRWTVTEMRDHLQEASGFTDLEIHEDGRTGYAFIIRRPDWVTNDCQFGICFSAEGKLGNSLLTEYQPLVGIGVRRLDHRTTSHAERSEVASGLHAYLADHWHEGEQIAPELIEAEASEQSLRPNNTYWPLYLPTSKSAVRTEEDWTAWSHRIAELGTALGAAFGKDLDRFAERTTENRE